MIYEIKFAHGESNIFATSEAELVPQSEVIIRSEKGTFYGKIIRSFSDDANLETHHTIEREVTDEDLEVILKLEELSKKAKDKVRQLVVEQELEMKIIDVAYTFDQMQLFISFTAENRVDFRLLLRELATTFRIRIELFRSETLRKFMADSDRADVLYAVRNLFTSFRMFLSKWPKIKIYL